MRLHPKEKQQLSREAVNSQRSPLALVPWPWPPHFVCEPREAGYYLAACLASPQVGILLYVAEAIVRLMWRKALDPDNFSIPYLTALGDLLGTGFLAVCFHLVVLVHGL